jgi:hypothetical protein
MGISLPIECPVEGCAYSATFRLSMGEENGRGVADRKKILRDEHPDHPPPEDAPEQPNDSN